METRPVRDGQIEVILRGGSKRTYAFSNMPPNQDYAIKDSFLVVPVGRAYVFHNMDYVQEIWHTPDSDAYEAKFKEYQRNCDHEWDEPPIHPLFGANRGPECINCQLSMNQLENNLSGSNDEN